MLQALQCYMETEQDNHTNRLPRYFVPRNDEYLLGMVIYTHCIGCNGFVTVNEFKEYYTT